VPGSWLSVASLSSPSRSTQYIPSNFLCWRAPRPSMLSLARWTLITTLQIYDLLFECVLKPLPLVTSPIRVHSGCYGKFSSNCSRDLSAKPFWRLMDRCVLKDDTMLRRSSSGLYRSEERFFCSEYLEVA